MNKDQLFKHACRLLDKAGDIWEKEIKDRYEYAEKCYSEAIAIYEEYFNDNKKVLTDELNPF
jgi:hypothetical protein